MLTLPGTNLIPHIGQQAYIRADGACFASYQLLRPGHVAVATLDVTRDGTGSVTSRFIAAAGLSTEVGRLFKEWGLAQAERATPIRFS